MGAAIDYANAAGALTVMKAGAQDAVPSMEEVAEFLSKEGGAKV
jgi:sugar/nucleoside kinase (ribokinase family)